MSSFSDVWVALAMGLVASAGLIVGGLVGYFVKLSHLKIAIGMSIGAGLFLAAISLKLAADSIQTAGLLAAVLALLLGAAVFSAVNALLARFGAAHRKRCGECTQQTSELQQAGSGKAIAVGTALDAVPEALVLGLALRQGVFPLELVIAFVFGNLAEALSGAAGMRHAGRSYRYVLLLWGGIAIGAVVLVVAGFAAFDSLGPAWPPRLQAFGAGALLATTAETMLPEAFHNSPRFSGFLAAIGFCVVLLVQAVTREQFQRSCFPASNWPFCEEISLLCA